MSDWGDWCEGGRKEAANEGKAAIEAVGRKKTLGIGKKNKNASKDRRFERN